MKAEEPATVPPTIQVGVQLSLFDKWGSSFQSFQSMEMR